MKKAVLCLAFVVVLCFASLTGLSAFEDDSIPLPYLSGNTLIWYNCESYYYGYATSYIVTYSSTLSGTFVVYNRNPSLYSDNTLRCSVSNTGYYKVEAYYDGGSSTVSDAVQYSPSLSAPTLTLSGSTLSWNAVSNATSYDIYKGGTYLANTTSCSYSVSSSGTYTVKAKASGYTTSVASNSVTYTLTLSAPTISLSGTTISWNAVSNATSYQIFKGSSSLTTVSNTTYTVSSAGTYTVKALASGYTTSVASNSVTFIPSLSSLELILVTGNIIGWSAVPNATSFEIYLGDNLLATVDSNTQSYVCSASGNYSVLAKASGYTSSRSNSLAFVLKLGAPQLVLSGNTISWEAVTNASSYEVYKQNSGGTYDLYATLGSSTLSYSLSASGVYCVWALNSSYRGGQSSDVSFTYVPNLSDFSVSVSGNSLGWGSVTNALYYEVYKDNSLVGTVTACSYQLSSSGSYYVKAFATGYNSSTSNTVSFTFVTPSLSAPYISISGSSITWDPISGATSYQIYWNADVLSTITSTTYSVSATGYYYVVALGDGYNPSGISNSVSYTAPALTAPVISIESTNKIIWSSVSNASSYHVYKEGSDSYETTSNCYYYAQSSGNYYVIACPGDAYHSNSVASNSVTYTPAALTAPTISWSNGYISWSTPSDLVSSYKVMRNGEAYSLNASSPFAITEDGTYYVVSCGDNILYGDSLASNLLTIVGGALAGSVASDSDYMRGFLAAQQSQRDLVQIINALWSGFNDFYSEFSTGISIGGITLAAVVISISIILLVWFIIKIIKG